MFAEMSSRHAFSENEVANMDFSEVVSILLRPDVFTTRTLNLAETYAECIYDGESREHWTLVKMLARDPRVKTRKLAVDLAGWTSSALCPLDLLRKMATEDEDLRIRTLARTEVSELEKDYEEELS